MRISSASVPENDTSNSKSDAMHHDAHSKDMSPQSGSHRMDKSTDSKNTNAGDSKVDSAVMNHGADSKDKDASSENHRMGKPADSKKKEAVMSQGKAGGAMQKDSGSNDRSTVEGGTGKHDEQKNKGSMKNENHDMDKSKSQENMGKSKSKGNMGKNKSKENMGESKSKENMGESKSQENMDKSKSKEKQGGTNGKTMNAYAPVRYPGYCI
jgi:hypothetical protein